MSLKIFFYFLIVVSSSYSVRILGIVPTPSYSHQVVFRPLWRELLSRGHHVTVLTTDPMNDPTLKNLTEIDLSISYEKWNAANLNEVAKLNFFEMMDGFLALGHDLIEEQFYLPTMQELVKNKTEQFDLVILEFMFPAMAAFAERFDCPLIQMFSLEAPGAAYRAFGNPSHPVLNPEFMLDFTQSPTFLERLISIMFRTYMEYLYHYRMMPIQNVLVKKHFGNNYPSIEDILDRTSMMFINTDNIFHQIRPLLPNIIQIGGGSHITPPKPLPKELQIKLDNAKNGFIYFSLGSNIKSKRLPNSLRKIFLETFAELPYTILWKFENDDLPGKPDNVIISKWLPQQDVLRHPNIKLFISQGGLQSTEEAIYNHVPIVGIPFIGDQEANIKKLVKKGVGLLIDYKTVDKTILKEAILEVLNNHKYGNRVKEIAELARDQPMTGLERAVWWTEYVIRHKGAQHLRSPAMDLPTYQYFLLDVIGFCCIVLTIVIYILVKLVKLMCRLTKCFITNPKIKVQ